MEDEELIGVYIKGFYIFNPNKLLLNPVITVLLVDKRTGKCISEVDCGDIKELMLSSPFYIGQNEVSRKKLLHEKGPYLLHEKISAVNFQEMIFLFELCQVTPQKKENERERRRIAWAFLVPVASDGSKNFDKEVKLQLFKVKKKCKTPHSTCDIYHLYKDHSQKKFLGVLILKIKGISQQVNRKQNAASNNMEEDSQNLTVKISKEIKITQKIFQWSRLPTQSCKIPNNVYKIVNLGCSGSSCLRFSSSGVHLAISSAHRILIYDVFRESELTTMIGHSGFIYDIDWSLDDNYLLSVSNDCTCIVWNLLDRYQTNILPHPSFVYCGKWFHSSKEIITGCRDHLMRHWMSRGDGFELIHEISGHSSFITSLALKSSCTLISGDSNGCLGIYEFHGNKWRNIKMLELKDISGGTVDVIHSCGDGNRIIATSRSKGSFMIDIKSGVITQIYKGVFNVILRSITCLTPCGSLFFSFCLNGEIGIWNAHTGKLHATYEQLFPLQGLSEICGHIHYNPYEHMIAIGALDQNYPVLILKYGETYNSRRLKVMIK